MVTFVTSSPQFLMNIHDNSKNKNLKKIYFVFHSIPKILHRHKNLTISEREGGTAHPWVGQSRKKCLESTETMEKKFPQICSKNFFLGKKIGFFFLESYETHGKTISSKSEQKYLFFHF